jgi:hypothetical protein
MGLVLVPGVVLPDPPILNLILSEDELFKGGLDSSSSNSSEGATDTPTHQYLLLQEGRRTRWSTQFTRCLIILPFCVEVHIDIFPLCIVFAFSIEIVRNLVLFLLLFFF